MPTLPFQEQLRDEHQLEGDLTIVYSAGGPVAYYRVFFGVDDKDKTFVESIAAEMGISVTGALPEELVVINKAPRTLSFGCQGT